MDKWRPQWLLFPDADEYYFSVIPGMTLAQALAEKAHDYACLKVGNAACGLCMVLMMLFDGLIICCDDHRY
jgi:hypothetical protein